MTAIPAVPTDASSRPRAGGKLSKGLLFAVLAGAGAFTMFTGLNRALGGIRTLGWQGSTDFLEVVSRHEFLVQDNHTRFLGGVWTGVGLLLAIAPFNLRAFRPILNFVFAIVFLGGLARFTVMSPDVVFGPDIVGSLVAELVGMPLLALWVWRTVRQS
jgi:hypothetical protein